MKKLFYAKTNYTVVSMLLWTFVVLVSLIWNLNQIRDHIISLADHEAKGYLERDIAFRKWASESGGVYIKVKEGVTPNPHLAQVPDRDIITTKGEVYTLRNPALIIRELDQIQNHIMGVGTKITSKIVLNPINTPDEWEKKALDIIENTRTDYTEIVKIDKKFFLRKMQPMLMEKGCLKCHFQTGIKEGEVRGATTYTVPLETFEKIAKESRGSNIASHIGIWIFGVAIIIFLGKKSQKAEEEKKKLLIAVEQSPSSIVITDSKANIEYVNPMFTQITGYTLKEVKGKNPRVLNSGLTPLYTYDELWKRIAGGEIWKGEFINKKKNGDLYFEEAYITPVKNADGEVINYIAVKLDITDRKKMENEVLRSKAETEKANRIKSDFLAIISHELRTPIHGILGINDSLLSSAISEEQKRQFEIIDERSRTLLEVVDNILKITELEKHNIELSLSEFSLKETIDVLLEKYKKKAQVKGIELKFDLDSFSHTWIKTDKERLLLVIDNLLNNALKFTMKGSITLSLKLEKQEGEKAKLFVSVRDTGKGIQKEFQERLFELFSQEDSSLSRSYAGSGLGLAICKRIARILGGDIVLDYSNSSGTCFTFFINCVVLPEREGPEVQSSFQKKEEIRILIAEDEAVNAMILTLYLNKLGYKKIDLAEDGMIAFEKFQTNQYDFLLTDLHMPNLTGFELAEKLKEHPNKPIILAITADVYDETRRRCLDLGISGVLTQPFSIQDIKLIMGKLELEKFYPMT